MNYSIATRSPLFGLVFLFLSSAAMAQLDVGSISGTIRDKETHQIISNAEVLLYEGGELFTRASVDENGAFDISEVRTGSYQIKVIARPFYEDLTDSPIVIEANNNTVVHLKLAPVEDLQP